jgi:colanic acid biosynthesis glycosyl transferase WcaI
VNGQREASTAQNRRLHGKSLKIVVLHQHYWPEIAATAQILTDLCEDLAAAGHRVTVLCGQPSYRRLASSAVRLPVCEYHAGVEIRRVWSYIPTERSIPKRLLHYGTYFASSLVRCLSMTQPDVCFAMSTPPLLLGISGVVMRMAREIPFVYSVQDLYPDIAIHLGVIAPEGVTAKIIEAASRLCFRRAAHLVTLSHGMAERICNKGISSKHISVIPNWADTSTITPVARDNAFAREHGLTDSFVVQYSGNLGLSQGLECLVHAAELVKELPVTFLLVGDGNVRGALEADVARRCLSNVRFLPPQPRGRLSELLGSSDVGLVTMKRGVGGDLVPSKLYGIMSAARPVLASVESNSEVARALQTHRCGLTVPPETPTAIADAVRKLFATPRHTLDTWGTRGREACIAHYSRRSSTDRYAAVLSQAAAAGPCARISDHTGATSALSRAPYYDA